MKRVPPSVRMKEEVEAFLQGRGADQELADGPMEGHPADNREGAGSTPAPPIHHVTSPAGQTLHRAQRGRGVWLSPRAS